MLILLVILEIHLGEDQPHLGGPLLAQKVMVLHAVKPLCSPHPPPTEEGLDLAGTSSSPSGDNIEAIRMASEEQLPTSQGFLEKVEKTHYQGYLLQDVEKVQLLDVRLGPLNPRYSYNIGFFFKMGRQRTLLAPF